MAKMLVTNRWRGQDHSAKREAKQQVAHVCSRFVGEQDKTFFLLIASAQEAIISVQGLTLQAIKW